MEQLKLPGNEIIRGEAPENIEQRCLTLCQDYIGGVWKTAKTTENITVTRITGGLTNQLYRVQLNSAQKCADTNSNDVPTDVAVKLYLKKHVTIGDDGVDDRLNDNIVLTLMSQTKIGPRVLGIFKEGNIQVFHEHELFGPKYHKDPDAIRKMTRQLARVNNLNVPISKRNRLIDQIETMIEDGYKSQEMVNHIRLLPNDSVFKSCDLREEVKYLKKVGAQLNAPVVFCHNDLLGSNILIVKAGEVLLIDLEYCAYGFRGIDLAMLLNQYEREPFEYLDVSLPEDAVIEQYLNYYIEACNEIVPGYSDKPENSLKRHVDEVKVATLNYLMILMAFFLSQKESMTGMGEPVNLKDNLKLIVTLYKQYSLSKQRFVKDGIIS